MLAIVWSGRFGGDSVPASRAEVGARCPPPPAFEQTCFLACLLVSASRHRPVTGHAFAEHRRHTHGVPLETFQERPRAFQDLPRASKCIPRLSDGVPGPSESLQGLPGACILRSSAVDRCVVALCAGIRARASGGLPLSWRSKRGQQPDLTLCAPAALANPTFSQALAYV